MTACIWILSSDRKNLEFLFVRNTYHHPFRIHNAGFALYFGFSDCIFTTSDSIFASAC